MSPKKEYGGDNTKQIQRNYKMYQADLDLIDYIAEQLGTNKTDALRTAVRSYAMHLEQMQRRR